MEKLNRNIERHYIPKSQLGSKTAYNSLSLANCATDRAEFTTFLR